MEVRDEVRPHVRRHHGRSGTVGEAAQGAARGCLPANRPVVRGAQQVWEDRRRRGAAGPEHGDHRPPQERQDNRHRWAVHRVQGSPRGLRGSRGQGPRRGFGHGQELAGRQHGRGPAGGGTHRELRETGSATDAAVVAVFREEAGRLTAALLRLIGDFDLAEEVVQDSLVAALERWPVQGVPDKSGKWPMTTARRRAIDILRRYRRHLEKLSILERSLVPDEPREADDRLRLIFTCCHPALAQESQVALTLRAVAGFTTPEIAAAFLVSEATMAQRIVRAKRKIVAANIPYRVPHGEELAERLDAVLGVLYLMFNEGYLSCGAQRAMRRDLAEDALWLGRLLDRLMPDQPEVLGL